MDSYIKLLAPKPHNKMEPQKGKTELFLKSPVQSRLNPKSISLFGPKLLPLKRMIFSKGVNGSLKVKFFVGNLLKS